MVEINERKLRAIYLDDEEMLLTAMGHILTEFGLEVTTHSDPDMALESMDKDRRGFDLALIDFRMDKKNGAEVLREMANHQFYDIPYVALFSAMPYLPEINEAFDQYGLNEYKIYRITKSYSETRELRHLLEEMKKGH